MMGILEQFPRMFLFHIDLQYRVCNKSDCKLSLVWVCQPDATAVTKRGPKLSSVCT